MGSGGAFFSDIAALAREGGAAAPGLFSVHESPEARTRDAIRKERVPMNEQEFQQKLGELISQINSVPEGEQGDLMKLAEETKQRHDRMKKTIADLQDSLDYLRLSV